MKKTTGLFSIATMFIALLVILFIGSAIFAIIIGGIPHLIDAIHADEIRFAFRLSFSTATLSTIIVMLLGLPTAYALVKTDMP